MRAALRVVSSERTRERLAAALCVDALLLSQVVLSQSCHGSCTPGAAEQNQNHAYDTYDMHTSTSHFCSGGLGSGVDQGQVLSVCYPGMLLVSTAGQVAAYVNSLKLRTL